MGFFRRLFGREPRAIDKTDLWGKGATDFGDGEIHAGVPVTQTSALRHIAVYACIRLLAETIAGLPADVFRRRGRDQEPLEPGPQWLRVPNPETTWFELVERIMGSLNSDGNAFLLIGARDGLGYPIELWTLNPREVEVHRDSSAEDPYFIWGGTDRLSRYSLMNPGGDVLHVKAFSNGGLRGLSPIDVARQAIGLGLVAEKFGSRFFGKGQTLSGVIELPQVGDANKTQEYIDLIKENWEKRHGGSDRSHLAGVLSGGAKWHEISISPENAQFLETRRFQVSEIARLFRVPPHMIGDVERSTSWGSGIEQQSIGFVQYCLTPWLVRLEHAFNQLTPRGQFIKWNVNGLLRGDIRSRAEFYSKGINSGWLKRAEPRRLEDLPYEEELEAFVLPSNMVVLGNEDEGEVDVGNADE